MPIERIYSPSLSWRDVGGNDPLSPQRANLKIPEDPGPTWVPDEGLYLVGEHTIREGDVFQPVFRAYAREYTDPVSSLVSDNKFVFDIARVSQADHVSYSFLPGATPDEPTIDGQYNAAMTNHPDTNQGPWGFPADVGGEFVDLLITDDVGVPQFVGGNQLFAIDLNGGGRLWHRAGYAEYPTVLAHFRPGSDDAEEFGGDPARTDLDYARESYTALGISGPPEDRRLIVEITKEYLAPNISPNYIDGRVTREINPIAYCSGDPVTYALSYTLRAFWQWRSAGILDISPSGGYSALGIYDGTGPMSGNPNELIKPTNFGPQPIDEDAGWVSDALTQLFDDCMELAERTAYKGHHLYKVEKRIESISLATGITMATRDLDQPCRLPGANICGTGTVTQTEYSQADVLSWPVHPGQGEDWTPDTPGRLMHHPPPMDLEGYVGGSYQTRGSGPLFLHTSDHVMNAGPTVFIRYTCPSQPDYTPPSYYNLISLHAGDFIATGTVPNGIYLPTLSDGTFTAAFAPGTSTLTLCYSATAAGEKEFLGRSLPWPFDPLSMACDETALLFGPAQFGQHRMELTREGQALAPGDGYDLPEWDDECERQHFIHGWDPLTLADLWAPISTRDLVGSDTLGNGRQHPNAGDRAGNLAIYCDHLIIGLHGPFGQRDYEIRIRDTDEGSAGTVARYFSVGDPVLLDAPFYLASGDLSHAPTNSEYCQDSLVVAGGRLWGITASGKIWQLA